MQEVYDAIKNLHLALAKVQPAADAVGKTLQGHASAETTRETRTKIRSWVDDLDNAHAIARAAVLEAKNGLLFLIR